MQAFMNKYVVPISSTDRGLQLIFIARRIFLNEAIVVSTHETSGALQLVGLALIHGQRRLLISLCLSPQLCKGLQLKDNIRLMDFLIERILESTATNTGTALIYRPFFKVFGDIILGPLLLDLEDYAQPLRKLASTVCFTVFKFDAKNAFFDTPELFYRLSPSPLANKQMTLNSFTQHVNCYIESERLVPRVMRW